MIKRFPPYIYDENDSNKVVGMGLWQNALIPTFEVFCSELDFEPKTLTMHFDHRLYNFAKCLNIDVPRIRKKETVELVPGLDGKLDWCSYDGRSTDYVGVETKFNKEKLIEFFQKLSPFLEKLERHSDMMFFVKD